MAALMEGLGGELTRSSREISEYGLAGYLDAAIRASSAQYDNPDVHNRLRIRLEHGAGSETGAFPARHITISLADAPSVASQSAHFH